MKGVKILLGDCRETLSELPDESVDCCVTSPPYFGLRDYGNDDQIGLEETPEAFIENMVQVFREVWRVLKPTGTLWLNLGDSYAGSNGGHQTNSRFRPHLNNYHEDGGKSFKRKTGNNFKPKDLIGIPWRVAFALQADGWYLRQDIIWAKPKCMPEPVKDRCTRSHEFIFMLTKNKHYFYDNEAIKEGENNRNKRDVWHINPQSFPKAHFAVYPPDLIEPCVLAGSSAKGCCADCGKPWVRAGRDQFISSTGKKLDAWRPNCECHGKLVREEVVIPAQMTAEEVAKTDWGVSTKGEYDGQDLKDYASAKAQSASETKRRILESRLKDKVRTMLVYHSDLPLDEHPIVPSVVLDPFGGSGTTAGVALLHGREAILCELSPEYAEFIPDRIRSISKVNEKVEDMEWI